MLLLQIAGDREGPAYRQICGRVRAARSQQTSGTHQTPLRSDANERSRSDFRRWCALSSAGVGAEELSP